MTNTTLLSKESDLNNDISYVIQLEESFENGVKRIIDDQVNNAIKHLTEEPDIHKGVHDARRALKITRAAWRLIRLDLQPSDFFQKNALYRDAGRQLSDLRDLTALLETLDMLQSNTPRMRRWVCSRVFRQALERKRDDLQGQTTADQNILLLRVTASRLSANYEEINQFQLSSDFIPSVLASIRKVYSRGLKAYLACKEQQDPELMHEWRKRTKYLRYHFHILRNVWPNIFTSFEKELHQLTDYLGDFNNLSVMKSHLANRDYDLKTIHRNTLLKEAIHHQEQLGQASLDLGARLYAESPKTFSKRMEAYVADQKVLK